MSNSNSVAGKFLRRKTAPAFVHDVQGLFHICTTLHIFTSSSTESLQRSRIQLHWLSWLGLPTEPVEFCSVTSNGLIARGFARESFCVKDEKERGEVSIGFLTVLVKAGLNGITELFYGMSSASPLFLLA